MNRIVLGLLFILLVTIPSLAQPVIVIPQPQVYYTQGRNGVWYPFCLDRCRDLLDVVAVDEWAGGYATIDAAIDYYNGQIVPRLLALPSDRNPLRPPPVLTPLGSP